MSAVFLTASMQPPVLRYMIKFLIPFGKFSHTFLRGRCRPESEILLQISGVHIGDRHIAGIHGNQLSMSLKVIACRQNTSGDRRLMENTNAIQQILQILVSDDVIIA